MYAHQIRRLLAPPPWRGHRHEARFAAEVLIAIAVALALTAACAQIVGCSGTGAPLVQAAELRGRAELTTPSGRVEVDLGTGSGEGGTVVALAATATVVLVVDGQPVTVRVSPTSVRDADGAWTTCTVVALDYAGWHVVTAEPAGCADASSTGPAVPDSAKAWEVLRAMATVLGPLLAGLV